MPAWMIGFVRNLRKWDGARQGEVFSPAISRYRYEGHRRAVKFTTSDLDPEVAVLDVLEFEPVGRPDRPHVYLVIPLFPATDQTVVSRLDVVVAELASAFRLAWHLNGWPDSVPGCGLVIAAVGPEPGWWRQWPYSTPGIEIPVRWLRGNDLHLIRYRSRRHESTAGDVAACLGTALPVWPTGTNDATVVSAWRPGGDTVSCPVPADRLDYWITCQYAAREAARLPGRGYAELASMAYKQLHVDADNGPTALDLPPDGAWAAAARLAPPTPQLPPDDGVSLLDAVHLTLGSPNTRATVGRTVRRLFGDPMRGEPVMAVVSALPKRVIEVIRAAPPIEPTTPREYHLLDTARHRVATAAWRLHRDQRGGVPYLYASSDTHVAWLPIGDRLDPSHGHDLLPDDPMSVVLLRNATATYGGWVIGLRDVIPLPRLGAITDAPAALASVVTGQLRTAPTRSGHLALAMNSLLPDTPQHHVWPTLMSWAEEFPIAEPRPEWRLPFASEDELVATSTTQRRPPIVRVPPFLPFAEVGASEEIVEVESVPVDELPKRDAKTQAAVCGPDPIFTPLKLSTLRKKVADVKGLPPGRAEGADKKFEELVFDILSSMFYPELDLAKAQVRTISGAHIRDVVFYNDGKTPFLTDLRELFGCRQAVFELKNVAVLETEHVNQLYRYLDGEEMGMFGVLVARTPPPASVQRNIVDLHSSKRAAILCLDDSDLQLMVKLLGSGRRPIEALRKKFAEFLCLLPK